MGKKRKRKGRHTQHKRGNGPKGRRFGRPAQGESHNGNKRRKPALVVAYPTGHQDVVTTKEMNPQHLGHYTSKSTILLVGEGNFTFAAALATKMGGKNITATGLDTKKLTLQKYEDEARRSFSVLRSTQAETIFGFDATQVEAFESLLPKHFDFVVFNFPHVGGSTTEDVLKNKTTLQEFFEASPKVLSERGEVHVTLRDTAFYRSWNIEQVANAAGLHLVDRIPFRSEQFASLGYVEVSSCQWLMMSPPYDIDHIGENESSFPPGSYGGGKFSGLPLPTYTAGVVEDSRRVVIKACNADNRRHVFSSGVIKNLN